MAVQEDVFVKQAEIAADLDRVMTVHCLKAWEELFTAMERATRWPEKFLMHSFGGSIEIAERLMKAHDGVMFSFSGYFLHERKRKVLEVFRQLPLDRILLETDAPEMMPPEKFLEFPLVEEINHPGNLSAISDAFEEEMDRDINAAVYHNSITYWNPTPPL